MDLVSLTTREYENLLSAVSLERIVKENPNIYENKAAYVYSVDILDKVMNEVYENFNLNASSKMKEDFEEFKKENAYWLDNDALYEALNPLNIALITGLNGKMNLTGPLFSTWDRNKAEARIAELNEKYKRCNRKI